MKTILVVFLLSIPLALQAEFRISKQGIWEQPEDSILHLTGSYAIACTLDKSGLQWWKTDLVTIGIGIAWEVKDGFVPYERYGRLGGEGLSFRDIGCNITGVLANRGLTVLLKYIRRKL